MLADQALADSLDQTSSVRHHGSSSPPDAANPLQPVSGDAPGPATFAQINFLVQGVAQVPIQEAAQASHDNPAGFFGHPPLTLSGDAVHAIEGKSAGMLQLASFAVANSAASDFTATVSWGDGTTTLNATVVALGGGNFAVEGAHSYAEGGSYAIGVSVKDDGGSTASASSTATVADAPLGNASGVNVSGIEGSSTGTVQVATFADVNAHALASDFAATIVWGDGATTAKCDGGCARRRTVRRSGCPHVCRGRQLRRGRRGPRCRR